MTTFYDLLNINSGENINNIIIAYKNKIKIFKNKDLDDEDILIIKQLKTALLILTNDSLRILYNNIIINKENNNIDILEENNDNIQPCNSNDENNLDSLFSKIIDKETDQINTKSTSHDKINNFYTDRIFNNINPNLNKITYNSITPMQTREERKLSN